MVKIHIQTSWQISLLMTVFRNLSGRVIIIYREIGFFCVTFLKIDEQLLYQFRIKNVLQGDCMVCIADPMVYHRNLGGGGSEE